MKKLIGLILLFNLTGCIGTDYENDPVLGEMIELLPKDTSILISGSVQLSASYFDKYGQPDLTEINFISLDESIATVDNSGKVTGVAFGQTGIYSVAGPVYSDTINVTVVGTAEDVGSVVITGDQNQIDVGDSLQLTATVYNYLGVELSGHTISWSISNAQTASIDVTGLVKGMTDGNVEIFASTEGISSQAYSLVVGANTRTGTFLGQNDYTAKGTATLYLSNDELILDLGSDFEASFAAGTYIFLSNSTSGSSTKNNGLNLGKITESGAHSFNVTEISGGIVSIDDYQYVIVLCEPFAITFGYAELN